MISVGVRWTMDEGIMVRIPSSVPGIYTCGSAFLSAGKKPGENHSFAWVCGAKRACLYMALPFPFQSQLPFFAKEERIIMNTVTGKRGQSALEYLMTYGWALVVIVIAVAALVVLINPAGLAGDTCDSAFGKLTVKQSNISPSSFQLELVNQTGQTVTFDSVSSVATGSSGTNNSYNAGSLTFSDTGLNPNETAAITITPTTPLNTGSYVLNLALNYDSGTLTDINASGACRGTI
jgi:hypothetical protein